MSAGHVGMHRHVYQCPLSTAWSFKLPESRESRRNSSSGFDSARPAVNAGLGFHGPVAGVPGRCVLRALRGIMMPAVLRLIVQFGQTSRQLLKRRGFLYESIPRKPLRVKLRFGYQFRGTCMPRAFGFSDSLHSKNQDEIIALFR